MITFDRSPVIPQGWAVGVTNYNENGMKFTPINPGGSFSRTGGGIAYFPENSTAYVLVDRFGTFSGSLGGARFGLVSVDLAEFSTLYAIPAVIQFVGYRFDGGIVTTEFTTDGIIDGTGPLADFQTFFFPNTFNDLVRFEVPSYGYALDNLAVIKVIPEPGTSSLLMVGAGVLGGWFFKSKRKRESSE
jgi:hypothetical protein